jgi:hypothetical protein
MFSGKSAEHAEHSSTYNLIQSQDKWTEFGTNSVKAHQIESANQSLMAIDKLSGALDKLGGAVDKLTAAQSANATSPEEKQALADTRRELADFRAGIKGVHDQIQQTVDANVKGAAKYESTKAKAHEEAERLAQVSEKESGIGQRFVTVGSILAMAITLATLSMAVAANAVWVRRLLQVGAVLLGLFAGTLGYGPRFGVDIAPFVGYDFSGVEHEEAGDAHASAVPGNAGAGEHPKKSGAERSAAPEQPHEHE